MHVLKSIHHKIVMDNVKTKCLALTDTEWNVKTKDLVRKNYYKDLKEKTELCIGPILNCLEAFLGFPVKTKI